MDKCFFDSFRWRFTVLTFRWSHDWSQSIVCTWMLRRLLVWRLDSLCEVGILEFASQLPSELLNRPQMHIRRAVLCLLHDILRCIWCRGRGRLHVCVWVSGHSATTIVLRCLLLVVMLRHCLQWAMTATAPTFDLTLVRVGGLICSACYMRCRGMLVRLLSQLEWRWAFCSIESIPIGLSRVLKRLSGKFTTSNQLLFFRVDIICRANHLSILEQPMEQVILHRRFLVEINLLNMLVLLSRLYLVYFPT